MKIFLLFSLLFINGLCLGMKDEGGFGDIFISDNKPQSVTVITSDQKVIQIQPEIARCMDSFTSIQNYEEEQPLMLVDSTTLNTIIAILQQQKIKPFADIIRKCKEDNEQLLIDYKNTEEQALEKLNKKETLEEAKTKLEFPQELRTFIDVINKQGKLIKGLNAFSFERDSVEKICETLDFTQILLLIRATNILGIPFLDDVLVTVAATKKVGMYDITNSAVDFLDQKYINNILHQKLFAIKDTLSVDIYPSAQAATRNPITGQFEMILPITMKFSPQGKYFIYQSFGTQGWIFKERVPAIVFWDCEKKKSVYVITDKHIGTIYYSPDQKYFSLIYPDWLRMNVATYDSNTLKVRPNIKDPLAPIKFIKKNIYIFDPNADFPLEETISQPFLTDKQIKMIWESENNVNLEEEQKKNEDKVVASLFSDPYECNNVHKSLFLSVTKKYIAINSTQDFSCVKIIPALIDGREFDIEKAAFSPSGKYLAACGKIPFLTRSGAIWMPTLRVWDTSDWSCAGTIIDEKNALPKERANTFSALSFSPDDSMIAVNNSYKKEVYFCGPLNVPNINIAQLNYCILHMQQEGKVDVRLQKLYNTLPVSIKSNLALPQWDTTEVTKQDIDDIRESKRNSAVNRYKAKVFGTASTNKLLGRSKVDMYKAQVFGSNYSKRLLEEAKNQKK